MEKVTIRSEPFVRATPDDLVGAGEVGSRRSAVPEEQSASLCFWAEVRVVEEIYAVEKLDTAFKCSNLRVENSNLSFIISIIHVRHRVDYI